MIDAKQRLRERITIAPNQEDGLVATERVRAIDDALHTLTPREAHVLMWIFGLDGNAPLTPREVGVKCGVTPVRIRQVKAKALRKLRHSTRSRALRPFFERFLEWR